MVVSELQVRFWCAARIHLGRLISLVVRTRAYADRARSRASLPPLTFYFFSTVADSLMVGLRSQRGDLRYHEHT